MSGWVTLPGTFASRPFHLIPHPPTIEHTEKPTMQNIEITTRLRVPDDVPAAQLREVAVAAAQAAVDFAADAFGRAECVLPLQDVIVYGGLVS